MPSDLFEARLKRDRRPPPDATPSFRFPFLFPLFVPVAMAPSMPKHRFQNSLDMVAARSMRSVERPAQAGTESAWCIVDSPTLGRLPGATDIPSPVRVEETVSPLSQLPVSIPSLLLTGR